MKLRPTVASVINEHVTLELESIDRLYLNIFVPQLQREGGVAAFFRVHRGHPFASSALMDPISKEFVARLESFAKEQRVPVVQFRKGERKDDIAAEYIRKFKQEEGVLFIGNAQEKTRAFVQNDDATRRLAWRIRGWCVPPPWSTTTTSTEWTETSGHSF